VVDVAGASTAELIQRAGHKIPVAALRYERVLEYRDRLLVDSLASRTSGTMSELRGTV